ncbi:MAG: ABC transporter ATP-binding protein [Lachnospiraceae bacterium]|nr:ABC transporter ATP-binding protein [Lachnospiraceae bacterium]
MREYYPLLVIGAVVGTLSAIFLGAFLTIRKNKEEVGFDRNMKDTEIIRRLFKYAIVYWKQYIIVFFTMVVSIAFSIVSPRIIGDVEEVVCRKFEMNELLYRVVFYVVILLISQGAAYIQAIMLQRIGQKILSAIRLDLFEHIESLSQGQLNHIPVGKLVTRETNDTNALSMLFTNILVNLIKSAFTLIAVVVAMFVLNVELTLMVLSFAPFIVLFTFVFMKFSRRAYRRVKDGTTDINTFLSENLSGIKVTQIFNNEYRKLNEFKEKNDRLHTAQKKQIHVFAVFRPMMYLLYIFSILALLYLGGKGYIKNFSFMGQTITAGILVSFYLYIDTFFDPVQRLAEVFNWQQSAFASAEKIFTILDMKSELVNEPDAIVPETIRGEIEFDHVWFAYKDDEWILKDVSMHIAPKETVAFVGATGAGKTTILGLVCRNYDIQKGRILIDGIDIRKYKVEALRAHFGQMLQDVFLFAGTVRSNIVLREDSFTDEEIWAACRYVNADRFIEELPNKLDEEIRERGNNLSAGQRQLLSFARAVIHKPDVMILDEATANIDTETEQLIQNSLEKMMNIGTMLIVAHRLSTIQHADRIVVINHGEIVESGSHFELLEKKGAYYELYKLQYEEKDDQ